MTLQPGTDALPPQPMANRKVPAQHTDAAKRRSAAFIDLPALVVQR